MPTTQRPRDHVSRQIRAALAADRRTQSELAAMLGISQPQVSARLNGSVCWSVDEVSKVATWLNIKPSWFMDGAA